MDQLVKFVLTFVTLISVASTYGVASPVGNATQADDASSCQEKERKQTYDKFFYNWQKLTLLGKKYLVSPIEKSEKWKFAKENCEDEGGTLATNLSPEWFEEASKLKDRCFSRHSRYWVGAKLVGSEADNEWSWISGQPLSLKNPNWKEGMPKFQGQYHISGRFWEGCVYIQFYGGALVLKNSYCTTSAFICELN